MIPTVPRKSTCKCDDDWISRTMLLEPYLRIKAVTVDQIDQALKSGLTDREIHNRLLAAECELAGAHDVEAYNSGWLAMVDQVKECDESTTYGNLREAADENCNRHKVDCYRQALLTGTPKLDIAKYSRTVGASECLSRGLLLVEYLCDQELACFLRSMPSVGQVRNYAARLHAIDSHYARFGGIWTPFGTIGTHHLGRLLNG